MGAGEIWRVVDFSCLPGFSRKQAEAWSRLQNGFAGLVRWQTWISEGMSEFFDEPGAPEIHLQQKHALDPKPVEFVFKAESGDITIGREKASSIRLALRSVGNRHARIFRQDGKCYIEDLGSALGTFLNESRLAVSVPRPISNGDQIAVFPYTFTVQIVDTWVHVERIESYADPPVRFVGDDFRKPTSLDKLRIEVRLQPTDASILIETSRRFLQELSVRMLASVSPNVQNRLGLSDVDGGLLELLVTAVVERINRDLPSPFQAEASFSSGLPAAQSGLDGMALGIVLRIGELNGRLRFLIADSDLERLAQSLSSSYNDIERQGVLWNFPISIGHTELTLQEIASIEPADVVMLNRELAILFPSPPERGWRLCTDQSNLSGAVVDKYFERFCLKETETTLEGRSTPDLSGLPVSLHAIIGEKTMTLEEADLLVPGAIVELSGVKTDPVRIALNGRIAGIGQLVEVEGRLGVRILSWKAS